MKALASARYTSYYQQYRDARINAANFTDIRLSASSGVARVDGYSCLTNRRVKRHIEAFLSDYRNEIEEN